MVVPTGFHVTQKPKPLFDGYSASCKPLAGSAKRTLPVDPVATVTLPYSNQSPHFIECFHGGKKIWVGKTTVVGFDVDKASNIVVMKMPVKYAKKRGFIQGCATRLGSPHQRSGRVRAPTIFDSIPGHGFAACPLSFWRDSNRDHLPLNRSAYAPCRR